MDQRLLERLMTPSLVVFMDRVRKNVDRLLALAGGDPDRLRVHVKTTKIPEVWRRIAAAGIRSFKCATVREAEVLLRTLREEDVKRADLLVAYPHLGRNLERLGELARLHHETRMSVLVEDPAVEVPNGLDVFVDVNPGMNRTGIPMADRDSIRAVIDRAGPRFRGLHFYEGHVSQGTLEERKAACAPLYAELLRLVESLGPVGEVVTSGTPTFVPALHHEGLGALPLHRVSPGTVVFFDHRSQSDLEELDFTPAALVFSRVVSHPAPGMFTCDAGSKAIAAEAGRPVAVVVGHPEWRAQIPSEEHLPFEVASGRRPDRGEILQLFPRHVCPTVNLATEAVLVDGDRTTVVEVEARGHDVGA